MRTERRVRDGACSVAGSRVDGTAPAQARQAATAVCAEVTSSLEAVKKVVAILVVIVALNTAAFLAASHLNYHGHYHCNPGPGPRAGSCALRYSYWTVGRAWWQIPAAILVAVAGLGVAIVLVKRSAPSADQPRQERGRSVPATREADVQGGRSSGPRDR